MMTIRIAALAWCVAALVVAGSRTSVAGRLQAGGRALSAGHVGMFQPATECMACHNGLSTSTGEDGELGARSVLAGIGAPGNHRSSVGGC